MPSVVRPTARLGLIQRSDLVQIQAGGGLEDYVTTSAYIGGGPSENGVDGSIRYLVVLQRALSAAEMSALSSTFSGTASVCDKIPVGEFRESHSNLHGPSPRFLQPCL